MRRWTKIVPTEETPTKMFTFHFFGERTFAQQLRQHLRCLGLKRECLGLSPKSGSSSCFLLLHSVQGSGDVSFCLWETFRRPGLSPCLQILIWSNPGNWWHLRNEPVNEVSSSLFSLSVYIHTYIYLRKNINIPGNWKHKGKNDGSKSKLRKV